MDTIPALPVSSAAALANGALYLLLTMSVILYRRSEKIVLGDGGDRVMLKRIRGQANAAEQIPVFLIVLALAEAAGAPGTLLAPVAAAFTLGRVSHAAYFAQSGLHWRFRFYGMLVTVLAQGVALLALATALLG
ncbi:hypothetical protein DDZ14_03510 [Maritimibacter sp. 55A14]|uniref:MAPEG family protein n=1 Tax=Maritimibacter sp. 55A14 TaxID=2174844 RepID=UPI000D61659D|nr:MAPEG family protein [Maritimibacter sp. 55A14]PWE33744.1 hypothetical protein DDZ14_03510 [Maritimibacter sp. 55A14]